MHTVTKIATCNYCGTRAALVLSGQTRHELSCSSCGAPLHNMKMLKTEAVSGKRKSSPGKKAVKAPGGWLEQPVQRKKSGKKKRKKPKTIASRLFDEAFDVIGDIFD